MVVTTLIGRADERARAVTALRRASGRGQGGVLLVTGEAGIGKSTLVRAVVDEAERAGFAAGVGKAEQHSQVAPAAPLLFALRSGRQPIASASEFDGLASVAGTPVWLIDRIGRLLEQRSDSTPVLLALDDYQWADHVTQVAVRLLSDRLVGLPVVWLLAGRGTAADLGGRLDVAGSAAFPVDHLVLAPLDDASITAIITETLGFTPDAVTAERLRGADGNPLVALQYAAGALGRSSTAGSTSAAVTLPIAVRARVQELSAAARTAVQTIAVWGEPIRPADLLAMSPGWSDDGLAEAVREAVRADLADQDEGLVRLRHDLVRDVIHDDLPTVVRAELHRRAAEHLLSTGRDALSAAPHMHAAAQLGDPRAVEVLLRGAEQSVQSLPETSAQLARHAFELVPRADPCWLEVGEQCVAVLVAVQHGREALELVDLLLTQVIDDEDRGRLQLLAAPALWLAGRLEELLRRVVDSSTGRVSDVTGARLSAWRAVAMTRLETATAARETAEAVLEQARTLRDRQAEWVARQALGEVARNTLDHTTALAHFRTLRINAGTAHLGPELAELRLLDRFDEADAVVDVVARDVDTAQLTGLLPVIEGRMWRHYMVGHLDHAYAEAQTLERVSRAVGVPIAELEATMALTLVAVMRGDFAEALDRMREADRRSRADRIVRSPRLTLLASLLAGLRGDPARAVAMVRPVMDVAEQSNGYFPRLPEWMTVHTALAMSAGDLHFARQSADRAQRAADRNPGVTSLRGIALHARGLVDVDIDLLTAAVEELERSPRPALLAGALSDLGKHQLRRGRREDAAASWQRAYDLFDRMGATRSARSTVDAARAGGAPIVVARPPVDAWQTLTPAELRVAELISAGLTNGSAARRLAVSPNTVATHLRSVFAKLDINSRVQLANRWNTRHV